MDNFFNSKKFILFCLVLLLCVALFGCAKPKPKVDEQKLGAIGNMLGCMFNPSLCEKSKVSEDQDEDWDEVDEK